MRVLYWLHAYYPYVGGVQVFSERLISALRRQGHEFAVVASTQAAEPPAEDQHAGVPVHTFPFYRALLDRDIALIAQTLRQVADLKRRFRPDLIHLAEVESFVLFHLRTNRPPATPTLITLQQHLPQGLGGNQTLFQQLFETAEWTVGVSQAVLARLHQVAPITVGKSSVIHNGLPAPDLQPAPLPLDPPVILCLGRLVRGKGFDLAISAVAGLPERFRSTRLVIAGYGPARQDLEAQVDQAGLRERTRFVGKIDPQDVWAWLNLSTVVLMPSREEAFPLVAVEASLMQRPVIAARTGGLPEAVLDGRTGLLVDPDDAASLGSALTRLLDHPPQAAALGLAARRHAMERFGWQSHVVDGYDALYRRLGRPDSAAPQTQGRGSP